jgi:anti-sigma factor ChrR (cupin superfamily)
MTAVTPKAPNHANLAPLASRFVDVASLPWEKTAYEGCECKTLIVDRETGMLTTLMKFAPNVKLPDHEHVEIEQTWVLEGSLICPEGVCTAGNFVWRPAGSRHEAWAGPEGGIMLAWFSLPNKFFQPTGGPLDFIGNDWQKTWGKTRERAEATTA